MLTRLTMSAIIAPGTKNEGDNIEEVRLEIRADDSKPLYLASVQRQFYVYDMMKRDL